MSTLIKIIADYFRRSVVISLLWSVLILPANLLFPAASNGHDLKVGHISIRQGLSQVSVFSIMQDHKGFMWFGTMDGLNRYDGYSFTIFRHDPFHPGSLSNNRIRAIIEDSRYTIWVGSDDGLNRFRREDERFTILKHDPDDPKSISNNLINCLLEDHRHNIWIGTNNGLNRLLPDSLSFIRYNVPSDNRNSTSENHILSLYEDDHHIIWVGTSNGLCHYDPTEDRLKCIRPPALENISVHSIIKANDGALWIGTSNGLVIYRPETQAFQSIKHIPGNSESLCDDRVLSLYQDTEGIIWIGTQDGLSRRSPYSNSFMNYRHDSHDPMSLGHNQVISIYEDRTGVVWIGCYGNGLNTYNRLRDRFHTVTHETDIDNTLSNSFVYAFAQQGTHILWIGTDDGLNRYDIDKNQYTTFVHKPGQKNCINNNRIRALFLDGTTLWIGSYGGLNKLDTQTGRFKSYTFEPDNPNSLSHNIILRLLMDSDGYLWIATNEKGLNRFDPKTEIFTRYTTSSTSEIPLSSNLIRTIYKDRKGYLWIGTYGGGVNRLDPEKKENIVFQTNPSNPHSISSNFVYSVHEDRNGNMWFGTYGGGISFYDPETGIFDCYKESDGLPNNVVYGILEDMNHNLWLSTNRGITKFNYLKLRDTSHSKISLFRNYDSMDGLQSEEFNFGAYMKNEAGQMYFGGISGYTMFNPDQIIDDPVVPTIVLTDFKIDNTLVPIGARSVLKKHISETTHLELPHGQNAFSFEFAALHYRNPEKNQYAYMLEGFDKTWTYCNAHRRYANYTAMKSGNYIFRVKASNSDAVWNDAGVALRIYIEPPYWETLWFRASTALLGLMLVVTIYKLRTFTIKQRNIRLESINAALNKEITERIKAEESLKVSEEKYRTFTENINAGLYRNAPEGNGKFIEVNPAFAKLFGYEQKEELFSKDISDLYMYPEDREQLNRKMSENGFIKNEELLLKRKDGTSFYCAISAVAVKDHENNIIYYDGLVEDISDRKHVEQALVESEEKYRTFVERASDGILIVQGNAIKYANSMLAQMIGHSVEEIIGSDFINFVHPEKRDEIKDLYQRRIKGEESTPTYETVLLHKNNSHIMVEVHAGLITFEGDLADLIFIRDITDRKQLEAQIRQTQKLEAIGQLAGGVAHDFNNILTVINGHAELALFRVKQDDPVRKDLVEISKSAGRASDLTRQLLAFSRKQMIEPKVLDINAVISDLDKMLRRLIGEDIEMYTILSPLLPNIKADPSQLEQVLMNLVINARDAIKENPDTAANKRITIETKSIYLEEIYVTNHPGSRVGPHALVIISDTGIGMDEETLSKIFDPFFTTKELGRGTGLGLTTVFGIVKQNDGYVYVTSEPKKGTSFKIYWPATVELSSAEKKEVSGKEVHGGKETILLVEDDAKVRAFARQALEAFGYSIIEAGTGQQALTILNRKDKQFDLIISDVVMPEMGGKELSEKVRAHFPSLPVLLVSGYSSTHTIQPELTTPNTHFIQKPYSIQDLCRKVRNILDMRKSQIA